MKNKLTIVKILFVVMAFLSVNMKCPKDSCDVPATSNYYASVNIYDQVLGIYTQTFSFTQTQENYSGADCPSSTSSTTLNITNLTPFTATYNYTVTYNLNLVSWSKQGSVVIPSKSTVDVGEVNESLARIDLGQIIVTYNNVSYK